MLALNKTEFSEAPSYGESESTGVKSTPITGMGVIPPVKRSSVIAFPGAIMSYNDNDIVTSGVAKAARPSPRPSFARSTNENMLTCFGVADYFLAQINEESGDLISNLKLQKLMYYAQGFHLAMFDKPLFAESIEAWMYGPVVPVLYHELKRYGAGALPQPKNVDFSIYTPEVRELLDEVYDVYGQFSAWKLAQMTHEEQPWKSVSESKGVISLDSMKSFFRTRLAVED